MNRNYALLIGLVLIGLAIAGGGYLWWSMKAVAPSGELSQTPVSSPVVTPEAIPVEEKSDLEQIREAFAEEYDRPLEEVMVNISENTGTHARGGISFAGEMGGGMWLAYKDGDEWKITYDGQGTIPCEAVDPYDFPTDMAPECWNEATGKLIQRG